MKKIGTIVLVLTILLMGGCSSSSGSDKTSKENNEKVKLEVMMFEGGFGSEWVKDSAKAYMEKIKMWKLKSSLARTFISSCKRDFCRRMFRILSIPDRVLIFKESSMKE